MQHYSLPDIIYARVLHCYVECEYGSGLRAVKFLKDIENIKERITHKASFELDEYFKGQRINFSCGIEISGMSTFALKVLQETQKIPYSSTITYSGLAKKIGTGAFRAIGNVLARNPIPIIIPCHRVVAKNGIGGYSGGIDLKTRLLELEQKNLKGQ